MFNFSTLLSVLNIALVTAEIAFPPGYLETFIADKEFLEKQKQVYDIIFHFKLPDVRADLRNNGQEFSVESNLDKFSNREAVEDFLKKYKSGKILTNNDIFSSYNSEHNEQAKSLIRLMFYAKDFETFYKTSLLYRDGVNNELFIQAFYIAMYYRPDTQYVRFPPIYEVLPHLFYSSELIGKARRFKEFGKLEETSTSGYKGTYVIPYNVPSSSKNDNEHRLNYYTEEITLADFYFNCRNQFPFFFDAKEFGVASYLRGLEYTYGHYQTYNHYLYHRMSNGLGDVEDYDHHRIFHVGYQPNLSYANGVPFPSRSKDSYLNDSKYNLIQDFEAYETRIYDAIDSGIGRGKDGETFDMYDPAGMNAMSNMVEGNEDSNQQYYGNLNRLGRLILGSDLKSETSAKFPPSVMEQDFNCVRDPAFWRFTKRITRLFYRYQKNAKPYKPEEIQFPDLKIKSVEMDELITYFEDVDTTISKGLAINYDMDESYLVKVCQSRLNYKPFNFRFAVTAKKPTTAYFRIFMGPKYDIHTNEEIEFSKRSDKFYILDHFMYNVTAGDNEFERSSIDLFYSGTDPDPSEVYYEKVKNALDGKEELELMKRIGVFPQRLILPKGKVEGMPFQFFFYVAPVTEQFFNFTSHLFGNIQLDMRPYNFPLDRSFRDSDFDEANFFFKDVMIYHQDKA